MCKEIRMELKFRCFKQKLRITTGRPSSKLSFLYFSRDRPICDAYSESLVYYSCHKLTKLLKRFLSSHKLCIRIEKYPGKYTGDDEFFVPNVMKSILHYVQQLFTSEILSTRHPPSSTISSSPTLLYRQLSLYDDDVHA